jgi:hypothetical protein
MVLLFAESGDGGIQCYAIEPGTELRFAAEAGPGFPELNNDLLEKVLTVAGVPAIDLADLVDHTFMGFYLGQEICLG